MNRRWIFWLLVIAFLFVVITRLPEIGKLAQTLAAGKWEWVLIAAALQIIYYVAITASFQGAFSSVEVKSRVGELMPVTFAAIFINVAAPSANVSGIALWADDAARRGQSPAKAAAGALLQLIGELITFTLVLFIGMGYLFIQHDLQLYEVIGAILLIVMTGGLTGILAAGLWRPHFIGITLDWLRKTSDRLAQTFKRTSFLSQDWAERNAAEFTEASAAIARFPRRVLRMLGILLIAHIIDLASLFAIFLAFNTPVNLGVLIAGYAMGILFWIVSPTPQGIGVVEGVMPIVLTSLSVPAAVAIAVSLAFRGLTFWLPLLIGFVVLRRVRTFGAEERSISESWFVRFLAILTALMGVINVISAIAPSMRERVALIETYSPLTVRHGGRLVAVLAGFALIVLARGLWQRKRMAWLATLGFLTISVISHLVKGLDYEEALLAAGLGVWLLILRDHFHAHADKPSIQQGLRILVTAFFFTVGYGVVGFYLLDRHYTVKFGLWDALQQTLVLLTQPNNPILEPTTGFGRYFADSISIVAYVTFGYALYMIIRALFVRELTTPEQRACAAQIVERYGQSNLAHLTLLNDKRYHFSQGGSLIAYGLSDRVAVALGDPIGSPEDLPDAISEFDQACKSNGWIPAFYQVLPGTLPIYEMQGFHSMVIGQNALVDLRPFAPDGRVNQFALADFQQVQNAGYTFRLFQPPLAERTLKELNEISDEWLTMKQSSEKRFSLGWFDYDHLRNKPLAAVIAPDGWITTFANVVLSNQTNEITFDLLRGRRDIEPGTMEYLVASLVEWALQHGYERLNMGLRPLLGGDHLFADPTTYQLRHRINEHISRSNNFSKPREFSQKFHPVWSPRYLVYPDIVDPLVVWQAIVRLDVGESNFLVNLFQNLWVSGYKANSRIYSGV